MTDGEPNSDAEARAWIAGHLQDGDPFHAIYTATERHRVEHACEAYASSNGPLLGVLARGVGARRSLEIGTALGYTAAWLAHGAPERTRRHARGGSRARRARARGASRARDSPSACACSWAARRARSTASSPATT